MTPDGLVAAGTTSLAAGLLIRYKGRSAGCPLRITQVFKSCIYVMPYSTPAAARSARKPRQFSRTLAERDIKSGKAELCKAELPEEFHRKHPAPRQNDSVHDQGEKKPSTIDIAYGWIAPIVKKFDVESNLKRTRFKAEIRNRADELAISQTTVRRTLLRYYYFGRVREALVPMVTGPEPGTGRTVGSSPSHRKAKKAPQRRGRQPVLASELGKNTFVVTDVDVEDMVRAAERAARKHLDLAEALDAEYMRHEFAKRHPKEFDDWINERCVPPVTERQFAMYTKAHGKYEREVVENIPALAGNDPGTSVRASGPGEIYEIDATGARIEAVDKSDPDDPVLLRTPWIYLVIDRWSRYIVAFYVTFGAPSWEELKYALLLAFTPRVARFRALGLEVDETRSPRGRIPFALAHDRGSELVSISNLRACVEELRIESLTMPPLTPNARLIERCIREIKRNMTREGLSGTYAKRPLDPKSRRAARLARFKAGTALREIYKCLLKIVDRHNNKPHTALKNNLRLIQAGVPPTPVAAYLWGCEHITGARVSSLAEKDLIRMLLATGSGSISDSRVKFNKRSYEPADAAALALANKSTSRARSVTVKFDKTFREELYVVTSTGEWSLWRMTESDRQKTRGIMMEEDAELEKQGALSSARAENRSKIKRATAKPSRSARPKQQARPAGREEVQSRRTKETIKVKEALTNRAKESSQSPPPSRTGARTLSWKDLEKAQRTRTINRNIQRRSS